MNATLWVIWLSLLTLFGASGLHIGGRYFPYAEPLADAWDAGYERGQVDAVRHGEVMAEARPPWDDTADALAERAAPYYEPLARGAASTSPAVTTARCPGEQRTLKGDSPGPGLPVVSGDCPVCGGEAEVCAELGHEWISCPRCGADTRPSYKACSTCGAETTDFVFVPANPGPPPSPIFDGLAAQWLPASPAWAPGEHFALEVRPRLAPKLATPPTSPPGGVAPEPSAPAPAQALTSQSAGAEVKPPRPGTAEVEARNATAGPGADPWQEITSANQDVWEPFTDTDVFRRISGDLDALRSALSAPVQLPPWKDSQ